MADYIKAYESWVNSDFFDEKTKAELHRRRDQPHEYLCRCPCYTGTGELHPV